MTRAEAAELLGVHDDASANDSRRRYEALVTDYQIRLTNAPTPALKKTYQQKLQELAAAAEVLIPGLSSDTTGADLPSPVPVLDDTRGARASTGVVRPVRPVRDGDKAGRKTQSAGLPKSTMLAGAAAAGFAALLSLVALAWQQKSTQVTALQAERDKLAADVAGFQGRVQTSERLMYDDRLRVRNLSQQAVKITAAAFVYRDPKGVLRVAHSGNFDYPTWEIRPGGVVPLDAEIGRGRLWDGAVIYYSFLVEYSGMEPFLKTGLWAEDIDRLDKVVTLDLD